MTAGRHLLPRSLPLFALVSSCCAASPDISRLPPPAARPIDFIQDVQPILRDHCYKCHGPDRQKSDFRLDLKAAALKGGEHGVDIRPGHSEGSPLIHFIGGLVEDMSMPPPQSGVKPLSSEQIGILRAWIDQGSKWPEETEGPNPKRSFWTFEPVRRPAAPQLTNSEGIQNPIDLFIRARLEKEGLAPSPPAGKKTLIRRLFYDLTGLPPAPEEVRRFLADPREDAYEELVDRLLSSPRYGECWGRHWLDTIHYGETHGYDKDKTRPNAWPYRDYVIRAFNTDKPCSRFVEEQLAGDVLFPDDPEGVVALGFIAAGPWDFVGHVELPESKTDGLIARYNDRDDMVMTTMATFQSLTVHCARCHDHKFDPIRQEEYYGLQAVFAGIDRADRWFDSDPKLFQRRKRLLGEKKAWDARERKVHIAINATSPAVFRLIDARQEELAKQREALPENRPEDAAAKDKRKQLESDLAQLGQERHRLIEALADKQTQQEAAEVDAALATLQAQLAELPPARKVFAGANDFSAAGSFRPPPGPRAVYVLRRGEVKLPIHPAEPGALSCLPELGAKFQLEHPEDEGSRRAALAKWITDPRNLLTRRSIVNRVWQYHFGRGIVDTPNDFGHMGSLPTHPELLDWLAFWFLDHGESIKELHRLILTSATYRQSSTARPEPVRIDADNRFLWRMNRLRLDAEAVHDALLFLNGRLDLAMGGPSVQQFFFKDDHSPVYDYARFDADSSQACRRSIYRFLVRSVPDPFMEALDCPDASLLTPKRTMTVTALQALALLNDPFVVRQCEHLAERLKAAAPALPGQVALAFEEILNRAPERHETERLLAYGNKHGLANVCRLLLNCNEFMFVD